MPQIAPECLNLSLEPRLVRLYLCVVEKLVIHFRNRADAEKPEKSRLSN